MSEDSQMQELRRDLEEHLRKKNFEQTVEAELKKQLGQQVEWEAKIKQACLTKIQACDNLANVNIDQLTD